jgi:hypothetical protein
MAGKNKVERSFRFLFNSQDLSGDLVPGTVSGAGLMLDEVDMTGVSDSVKKALGGWSDSTITAQFHMNDTATTGATTVLNALVGSSAALAMNFGASGSAPTSGDPSWAGTYLLLQANVTQNGGKFVHDCVFKPVAGSADPAWTTV